MEKGKTMAENQAPLFVFISYSRVNSQFVTRLRADLQSQGINTWIDQEGLRPGTPDWEEALRNAVRAAYAVLLIASPNSRQSPYVKDELSIAKEMYQRPVYPIWVAGEQWMDAIPMGWGSTQYIDAREALYATAVHQIATVLHQLLSEAPQLPIATPELDFEPRNPYKGLHAFIGEDACDFFGRETLIHKLAQALQEALNADKKIGQSRRLLTIIGSSGSGKSSVMMAGLLPRLRCGEMSELPGSKEWVYLDPMVPGKHPIDALIGILKPHFPDTSFKTLREDLEDDTTGGLHLLATQLDTKKGSRVVLLVDQLEELFTQTESKSERQQFLELLFTAATTPDGPLLILLTLRADFYHRLMEYPALYRLIEPTLEPLLPMEVEDLRATIEQPAALPDVQLTFEGNLVGDLLFEVQGQVGALPLLQFALYQLFERRSRHLLTLQSYNEIGGVRGALSQHTEKTYQDLPSDEHRRLARVLFLRLLEPGASEQDTTRRRAALSEFTYENQTQNSLMRETIDAFIKARLLTTNEVAGTTTIEVSHEAVIREWKRLVEWLLEARDDIRFQQDFSEDVVEWERRKQPKDRLYRGTQLKEAQGWARRNMPSEYEGSFLRASIFHQTISMVRFILIFCLLASSGGGLIWYVTHLPAVPPNPALVTNLKDDGAGSLRWSIAGAPSGSTIKFAPNVRGTIKLTSNDISIDKKLTIQGPGASLLTISSTGPTIQVSPRASVTISGLSFKDGTFTNMSFIVSEGKLIVTNSIFSNNVVHRNIVDTFYGSSITNGGNLTVINSIFSNNTAEFGGGAIDSSGIGNLVVINCNFSNNSSQASGGAIQSLNATIVTNSTFSNNQAFKGGALYADNLIVANSTFIHNQAVVGGAIEETLGNAIVISSTIYGNQASSTGGGIAITQISFGQGPSFPTNLTLTNSIVAANRAPTGPDIAGKLITGGYNLIQDYAGITFLDPNQLHITDRAVKHLSDLKIDSQLSNNDKHTQTLINGGHTQVLKLQSGSPAIDVIPHSRCLVNIQEASSKNMTIATDQLDDPRPNEPGGSCDIGAYESSY